MDSQQLSIKDGVWAALERRGSRAAIFSSSVV